MNRARVIIILFFVQILNLVQSFLELETRFGISRGTKIYFAICIVLLAGTTYYLFRNEKIRDQAKSDFYRIKAINLPKPVKYITAVVFCGNLLVIIIGKTVYPFADVGMFRHPYNFNRVNSTCTLPVYYFKDDKGTVHWLHLRKEHLFFLSDYLSWGYNNEFTFSATYHYKGSERNFEYISKVMKENGYPERLFVGTKTVDYTTGEVTFDTTQCAIQKLNSTKGQYYGVIYVPFYQSKNCQ